MVDEYDELDPTPTEWNTLTRPAQAKRLRLGNGRSTSTMPSFQQHLQPGSSPIYTVTRPVPDISSVSITTEELSGLTFQQNPLQETPSRHAAHPLQETPSRHAAHPLQEAPSRHAAHPISPAFAPPSSSSSAPGASVTLVHHNGVTEEVPVEVNTNRRNQKQRKSKKVTLSDFECIF